MTATINLTGSEFPGRRADERRHRLTGNVPRLEHGGVVLGSRMGSLVNLGENDKSEVVLQLSALRGMAGFGGAELDGSGGSRGRR